MEKNLILFRQISVLSVLFGAIVAVLSLIPYIGGITYLFLICFMAPLVIWLLVKYNCISLTSTKDSILVGAIAGFVGHTAFALVFIPLSLLLIYIFKYAPNYGVGMMFLNSNVFLLFVISLFLGVVGATINAFTGFLTYYVIELINTFKK